MQKLARTTGELRWACVLAVLIAACTIIGFQIVSSQSTHANLLNTQRLREAKSSAGAPSGTSVAEIERYSRSSAFSLSQYILAFLYSLAVLPLLLAPRMRLPPLALAIAGAVLVILQTVAFFLIPFAVFRMLEDGDRFPYSVVKYDVYMGLLNLALLLLLAVCAKRLYAHHRVLEARKAAQPY